MTRTKTVPEPTERPRPEYVRRKEAASIVKLAVGTLENLACRGEGPPYFIPPRTRTPLYDIHELHRWIEAGRVQTRAA